MLALLILLAGAPGAGNDLEKPPHTMPLFDGEERSHQPPSDPLQRPKIPDYRHLFDLAVACWPQKSWFRGNCTWKAAWRTEKTPRTVLSPRKLAR